MNAPSHLLRFRGPVKCLPGPGRAGITFLGRIDAAPAQLSLIGTTSVNLPATLDDVSVETLELQVLLRSGSSEWRIPCKTWQLHRDAGAAFYAAIPPRPTPWTRRLTWRVLLGLAATAPGRWLLSRR